MYPLTGSPQQAFYHDDVKDLDGFWKRLVNADKRKFPMCCATYAAADKDVDAEDVKGAGLQDAHAYTLIGAKKIVLENLNEVRLLKVRNPYGRMEWTGAWSDKSKKWTIKTRA